MTLNKPTLLLSIFFLFNGVLLSAQGSIREAVARFGDQPSLRNAVISVDVREVRSGRSIAAYDAELACIPASTQKLITTAVAMDVLGEDYRFTTRLVAGGPIEDGVLSGNLYIVGGGDPTLGSPFMDDVTDLDGVLTRWVNSVKKLGIKHIEGAVVGDGGYYGTDAVSFGWPWSDIGNYYGAGAYGLSIHENFYYLSLAQRQRIGTTPPVNGTAPEIPGLRIVNELRSGPKGSGDQAYIFGAPYNYDHYLRGSIPIGTGRFRIKGAIPDPPSLTAHLLDQKLEAAGIKTGRPSTSHRTIGTGHHLGGKVIDELRSPTLAAIIDRTNLRSNNLYAETLLREINKARGVQTNELASTDGVKEWLTARGLDTEGIQLQDGSGLAPRNFFSASFMTQFLVDRAEQDRWRQSIPLAGRTGSLKNALRGTAAEGRLYAKSGTLNAARGYAGYVKRSDGRELAFSIMINNYTISGRQVSRLLFGLMEDLATETF